jgi:hypothetical protein
MFFDDEDDDDRRVVYVERGSSSVKALLLGALIGAGIALLYAPQSGEETRRGLKRRLRKVRALAEEKVDELGQRFSGRADAEPGPIAEFGPTDGMAMDDMDDEDDVAPEMVAPPHRSGGAREELERRLEQARARRRGAPAEEPRA